MGKILKRFIYGYIVLVVVMLIGLVVMTIHHVVSTELLERETKKFVYEFIQVLQEDNYDELASMMISEERDTVLPIEAKESIEDVKFDKLEEMNLQTDWQFVSSHGNSKERRVYFHYDSLFYGFNCVKTEDGWRVMSFDTKF